MNPPRPENRELDEAALLARARETLARGFADLPATTESHDAAAIDAVLQSVAQRLQDNFPYRHPLYAGQMLKPPHPVARLAYALAQDLNPNNHALDGGRASSAMEREAVSQLAAMFGWREHLGHLTGGGTMANLEALWIAGRTQGTGKRILGSSQAHYTHARISEVLQLEFAAVPVDRLGRMDLESLERELARGDVGTVVATLGTTALGAVDPLPGILALRERYGFRLHVDAAYGGYFRLAGNLNAAAAGAFAVIDAADSIVVDPHKHGLQPYGCGCVLFRDPSVGRFYRHDSPYTYFSSPDLHLGEISLECSRAGAAAVALWATQRHLPLEPGGAFADMLQRCRAAALQLHEWLGGEPRFQALLPPELDIVVWSLAGGSASACSRRNRECFSRAARAGLHLALVRLPRGLLESWLPEFDWDEDGLTCLRSCLMKPEHQDWLPQIRVRLLTAAGETEEGV